MSRDGRTCFMSQFQYTKDMLGRGTNFKAIYLIHSMENVNEITVYIHLNFYVKLHS